jgi:hypothetical protein
MKYTNMNLLTFIDHIITFNNIDDILNSCQTPSEQGFIFERIIDLTVKLNTCPLFPNYTYTHKLNNANLGKQTDLTNLDEYLEKTKVISGNSGGCSDITTYNNVTQTTSFITCKYFNNLTKSVFDYDVQNIIAMLTKNKYIYLKYKIFLIVSNKEQLFEKLKKSNKASNYITDNIHEENVFDKQDVNNWFLKLKDIILKEKDILKLKEIILKEEDILKLKDILLEEKYNLNFKEIIIKEKEILKLQDILLKEKEIIKLKDILLKEQDTLNLQDIIIKEKEILKLKNFILKEEKLTKVKEIKVKEVEIKLTKKVKINYNKLFLLKKETLQLRFHQYLFVLITNLLILAGFVSFLWAAKCRSGKSFTLGGLISSQFKSKKKLNVLIITPAPTETASQFIDDLFNKFEDFSCFKIHNITSSKDINNIILEENNIFVISKQLLQKYINKKVVLPIKNLNLDIISFDENHHGGTTNLAKDILRSYCTKNTVKIYLTATYMKPLQEWNICSLCQLYWDIEDEQICKSISKDTSNISKLYSKYNNKMFYIKEALSYFTQNSSLENIFNSYEKMPDLHLITNMFDNDRFNIIKEHLNISNNGLGFSFTTLFSLNKTKTNFTFKFEVIEFLRYISGSYKELNKDKDKNIFTRIYKFCSDNNSRTPFTQLWFLPSDNISEISLCLNKLMQDDKILKEYDVLLVNRKNKFLAKDIKNDILKSETEATNKGKRGLIILAGNMLTLGITLSKCDVVMLLHDSISVDKVLQQMFRCMTEDLDKKYGFIVDLNISRVLNTCVNYNIKNSKNKDIATQFRYIIENSLINIDRDLMNNKDVTLDIIINKLINVWKTNPVNSFKSLLQLLDNNFEQFDDLTQTLINSSFSQKCNKDINAINLTFHENNQDLSYNQDLSSGHIKTKEKIKEKIKENIKIKEKQKEIIHISFTHDVLPYVLPLVCILTLNDDNLDFNVMLASIKENKELLEVFNDQCFIWWKKKNLFNIITKISSKFFNTNSVANNISVQFKTSMKSLIDNPKELLELITECLKPKELEKKQFGEVFTPMFLVNEMLDKLPKEVWLNKNLKWFDPASGMGNFPIAIYLRLMISLEKVIPDKVLRKKHILENMLYMSELNNKNVMITSKIFNVNNRYKLNIHKGDSLILDIKKTFNVDNFDIIVGNPPYNAPGTRASGNIIWHLFVKKAVELLKENGYLNFVHPNGWRKPTTEKSTLIGLFDMMTRDNSMIYLEIHNAKDGLKYFHCGTRYDWYVLQKIKNKNIITNILDENNITYETNLMKWPWLPNCEFKLIKSLLVKQNEIACDILYNRIAYDSSQLHMSSIKTAVFKYPVVHSTTQKGTRFIWSSVNNKGLFNVSKVIFGESGINDPIVDFKGKYGMSQGAMAILINSKKEGDLIKIALKSDKFNKVVRACLWSSFRIDWRMFKSFRKDFYKEFVTED